MMFAQHVAVRKHAVMQKILKSVKTENNKYVTVMHYRALHGVCAMVDICCC